MNSLMIYFNIYIVLFSFYTEFVCWFLDYLGNIFEDLGLVLPISSELQHPVYYLRT